METFVHWDFTVQMEPVFLILAHREHLEIKHYLTLLMLVLPALLECIALISIQQDQQETVNRGIFALRVQLHPLIKFVAQVNLICKKKWFFPKDSGNKCFSLLWARLVNTVLNKIDKFCTLDYHIFTGWFVYQTRVIAISCMLSVPDTPTYLFMD